MKKDICDKNCNCKIHKEGYPLPKCFFELFMGIKNNKNFIIKLTRKGKLIISEVQKKNN